MAAISDHAAELMSGPVDPAVMSAQAEAIADTYRGHGVTVYQWTPPDSCPPNVVFQRDLFFMTPQGAVLARPASEQRAGEERHTAAALAAAGFPILRTLTGRATLEGADALWLDRGTVIVGVGFRTNRAGAAALREVLASQRVDVVEVPLGPGVQHLLGSVVFLDRDLAAVRPDTLTEPLRRVLAERGYRLLEFGPTDEVVCGRGMNVVPLGPRRVVMPAGAPGTRRSFVAAGVDVIEVGMGEYVRAAGGLGCVTGILARGERLPG
jgi:N-dimethylarginine dimethylaminohydrolase